MYIHVIFLYSESTLIWYAHLFCSLLDVLLLGINATTPAPVAGQNCVSNTSNSVILDKLLVTAPSWSSVQQDLTWTFLLHIYGFACLFFVLGFYTFFSILNLRYIYKHIPPIHADLSANICIFTCNPFLYFSGLSYQTGRSCRPLMYSYVYSEYRELLACS